MGREEEEEEEEEEEDEEEEEEEEEEESSCSWYTHTGFEKKKRVFFLPTKQGENLLPPPYLVGSIVKV